MKAVTWNGIYLFSKGINDEKIYQNTFTNGWSGWSLVDNSVSFSEGLAATATESSLYLFGVSNEHAAMGITAFMKADQSIGWTMWEPIPGNGEKFYSSLAATNNANKEINLLGIKYNSLGHGIGIVETDYTIPTRGIENPKTKKWTDWVTLDNKEVANPPAVCADLLPPGKRIILVVSNQQVFYRFLNDYYQT